jgi:outer membrane protein assembly factor BamB
VRRFDTTISCRAFGLTAVLLTFAASAGAADKRPPPRVPIALRWTVSLVAGVVSAPANDGTRAYLALRSGYVAAYDLSDGHGLWVKEMAVTVPLAATDQTVFVAGAEAIQALRGSDGATLWTVPRVKIAAPLRLEGNWLLAVTDTEVLAIQTKDGQIVWRHAAGGVRLAPAIDGDDVYLGAQDGRVVALKLADGSQRWEKYLEGGVTAIAAYRGRVYAGAGDKQFYCLHARNGSLDWGPFRIGALATGRIGVDDEHVYFASLDNVIRGLDRATGNQRWQTPLRERPTGGASVHGRVVFVPTTGAQIAMLLDANGRSSGNLVLPSEAISEVPPDIRETSDGVSVIAVSGGLENNWQMTFFATTHETAPLSFSQMDSVPGLPYLTDPQLDVVGVVLRDWLLADPPLRAVSTLGWPLLLSDPPLEPLTALPGLQLRPLSPVLPVRRGE